MLSIIEKLHAIEGSLRRAGWLDAAETINHLRREYDNLLLLVAATTTIGFVCGIMTAGAVTVITSEKFHTFVNAVL